MLLTALALSAQDAKPQPSGDKNPEGNATPVADVAMPKEKHRFFESISVGIDLLGPGMRYFSDQGDYQAYAQLNIKGKFLPAIEAGYGTADKSDITTKIDYKAKGTFFRIGCDYNILKNKHDDYRLMVGLRYGFSSFNYDTTGPVDSLMTEFTTTHETATMHWAEVCFGVDAKVWGPLHMGWSVRYRRRLKCSDYINDPQYAPGYGNAVEGTRLMGLYTISLQF